jgi:hypothetical protein
MNRILILASLLFVVSTSFAQIEISNGNVGIKTGTQVPLSSLSVNSKGNSAHQVDIYTTLNRGLYVYKIGGSMAQLVYGVYGNADVLNGTGAQYFGLRGDARATIPQNANRAYGVVGMAGNSTSGHNYGVLGELFGAQNGAGVYGCVDVWPQGISGRWAGYFAGDVKVTGTLTAVNVQPSDERFKKNVVSLDNSVLDKVLQMNPIEYNYTQTTLRAATQDGDTITPAIKMFDEKAQMYQKKHYGLVAQELETLYPNLIYKDDAGFLHVNYIDIIPLLIQSIKEQNNNIEMLQKEVALLQATNDVLKSNEITTTQDMALSDTQKAETLLPIIIEALKEQRLEIEKKQVQIDKLQKMIQTLNARIGKLENQ